MKIQKVFKFNFNNVNNLSNFYTNSTNIEAFNAVFNNAYKNIFLKGPNKSGKSYLGKLWSDKYHAIKYDNNFNYIINNKKNILIDDIENINDEEKIFHIINHCNSINARILIISNQNINDLFLVLTDLISRLKIFSYFKIENPDDDMLLNILTKLFSEKQFVINSHDIFEFIIKRANRSYEDMFKIVDCLDKLSLEKKRQLTIPLIKEIL